MASCSWLSADGDRVKNSPLCDPVGSDTIKVTIEVRWSPAAFHDGTSDVDEAVMLHAPHVNIQE